MLLIYKICLRQYYACLTCPNLPETCDVPYNIFQSFLPWWKSDFISPYASMLAWNIPTISGLLPCYLKSCIMLSFLGMIWPAQVLLFSIGSNTFIFLPPHPASIWWCLRTVRGAARCPMGVWMVWWVLWRIAWPTSLLMNSLSQVTHLYY